MTMHLFAFDDEEFVEELLSLYKKISKNIINVQYILYFRAESRVVCFFVFLLMFFLFVVSHSERVRLHFFLLLVLRPNFLVVF